MPLEAWQLSTSATTPGVPPSAPTRSAAGTPLPDGVRLVLSLPPGPALAGLLTRDWVRPTATVPKS